MAVAGEEEVAVEREEEPTSGRYLVHLAGAVAEMTYYSRIGESTITIEHAKVPKVMRGRSVGKALVQRAVEDARKEGSSIIPVCSFVKAQIERHPEWQDVLAGNTGADETRPNSSGSRFRRRSARAALGWMMAGQSFPSHYPKNPTPLQDVEEGQLLGAGLA